MTKVDDSGKNAGAANGEPEAAGAPDHEEMNCEATGGITSEMVAAGYVALISGLPELTLALSPEDARETVVSVYEAMTAARR